MKRILPFILAAFALACSGPDFQEQEEATLGETTGAATAQTIFTCGSPPICPLGYTQVGSACSDICLARGFECLPRGKNQALCELTPSGTISASPTKVRINLDVTTTGSSNICWSVNNTSMAEVWVSSNGLPEALMGRAASACMNATWFHAGDNMVFRLYEGTAHTKLLGSVNVTAEGYHGGICGPCATGYSCFCGDRVCRREGTLCP
ncbi:hypothetical protein [Corallococcus aberystwythensis]|uniref:Lipoprotein n=1 Tax=Corallococcus aberystwythensis TaxID=2316722 RepID=A0A3A8QEI7_9BACT|nr:hypothetical protein [Corallococcus aberystwythensis]RKH64645.1 hypothetical protein D7W81_18115 [Corallococcus aberystwythensis]